ncbi:hypothetical protein C8Q79DRAFT_1008757 [Trametes meyenii]|nr:hypothetical protein C8Q79DRAFT_1008757 [Trametes meyenii]
MNHGSQPPHSRLSLLPPPSLASSPFQSPQVDLPKPPIIRYFYQMARNKDNSLPRNGERSASPAAVFTLNARSVFFYLYGTNEPDSPGALTPQERKHLGALITQNGGILSRVEKDADTIVVSEAGHSQLSNKYSFSRSTYVEPKSFVQRCIAEGRYRHDPVQKRPLGGRHGGRTRIPFTKKDDDHLCRWIATVMPDKDAGGRKGIKPYLELVEKAQYDDLDFRWAARHPAESWRERYKNHEAHFDRVIARLVKEDPPPVDGKGVRPYDRRVNRNALLAFYAQQEGEDEADFGEEERHPTDDEFEENLQGGAQERQRSVARAVSPRPRAQRAVPPPPRAASSRERPPHGRHSAPPLRTRQTSPAGAVAQGGEFEAVLSDDDGEYGEDDPRPGPEDAGPSRTQRTPTPPPQPVPRPRTKQPQNQNQSQSQNRPAQKAMPRAQALAIIKELKAASQLAKAAGAAPSSQAPASTQATLVGTAPTQPRGSRAPSAKPPATQARESESSSSDEEDEEPPQQPTKRRKILPKPRTPAVEPEPLREKGLRPRGAAPAPATGRSASRGFARKTAQSTALRLEPENIEDEDEIMDGGEAGRDVPGDGDVDVEMQLESGDGERADDEPPQAYDVGMEDEQDVEQILTQDERAPRSRSPSPAHPSAETEAGSAPKRKLDSDDERSRAKLRPAAPSAASRRPRLRDAERDDEDSDEEFAAGLDFGRSVSSGSPAVVVPATPNANANAHANTQRGPARVGSAGSGGSTSSVAGVPLDGTRASAEKRRRREAARREEYVPPPETKAAEHVASVRKLELRSRTVVGRQR